MYVLLVKFSIFIEYFPPQSCGSLLHVGPGAPVLGVTSGMDWQLLVVKSLRAGPLGSDSAIPCGAGSLVKNLKGGRAWTAPKSLPARKSRRMISILKFEYFEERLQMQSQ